MKTSEIMLGDYFNVHPSNLPIKVAAIHRGKVGYHACTDKLAWIMVDLIRPIPITPEVLARMGFTIEEVPKYYDTYTEDEYTATIKCVDIRKCEVEIEYKTYWKKLRAFNYDPHNRLGFTSIETQVEYVHELQHILKVMKVDKELELLKERRSNQ